MARQSYRVVERTSSLATLGYALVAFLGLAVALAVGWWIAVQADLLGTRFDRAYYILLVLLGISVAVFLFGVLRSTATVTGKHLGIAFEIGGPAALAVIVVVGGFWFTKPPESFSVVLRLVYHGPSGDRAEFDEALSQASLWFRAGPRSTEHEITASGEVSLWDLPGRLRDGGFTVELVSDLIYLPEYDNSSEISFPAEESVVELKTSLRESPERRAAREETYDALREVAVSIQRTLQRNEMFLFPAISTYVDEPSEDHWVIVMDQADRMLAEIERGLNLAFEYNSRYGGLLGSQEVLTTIGSARQEVRRLPQQPGLGEAISNWAGRSHTLRNPPDPRLRHEVLAWQQRLEKQYQHLYESLVVLVHQLTPST